MINKSNNQYLAGPITIIIFSILYTIFTPYWQTNDDVGMSMIAHGYGIATFPSEYLIFSNAIWGLITKNIPSLFGILGYSLATITILMIGVCTVLYILLKNNYSIKFSIIIILIIFTRPIIYPQFTIISGIAFISGCALFWQYKKDNSPWQLLSTALLFLISSLIRFEQFILMAIIALPLLIGKDIKKNNLLVITLIIFIFLVAGAQLYNTEIYNSNEWNFFISVRQSVSSIVNFHVGRELINNPEILKNYSVSVNDINLLRSFFFADLNLINIETINKLTQSVQYNFDLEMLIRNLSLSFKSFFNYKLVSLTIIILISLFTIKNKKLLFAFMLFIIAIFGMNLLDRPAVERVIYPILILLSIFPFIGINIKFENKFIYYIGIIILSLTVVYIYKENKNSNKIFKKNSPIIQEIKDQPSFPLVVIGSDLPYEHMYPVLSKNLLDTRKIYSISSFTWAPFSVSNQYSSTGNGFKEKFLTEYIPIATGDLTLIKNYCNEHFAGMIEIKDVNLKFNNVMKVRCHAKNDHFGYKDLISYINKKYYSHIYISSLNDQIINDLLNYNIALSIKIIDGQVSILNRVSESDKKPSTENNKILILNLADDRSIDFLKNDKNQFYITNRKIFGSYIVYNIVGK